VYDKLLKPPTVISNNPVFRRTHINAAAKQCYFTVLNNMIFITVFKIKHKLYIFTVSTPTTTKKKKKSGCVPQKLKNSTSVFCLSYFYHSLKFLLHNRIQNPFIFKPCTLLSCNYVFSAEEQITGTVCKPEMAKICTRTIHKHFV